MFDNIEETTVTEARKGFERLAAERTGNGGEYNSTALDAAAKRLA
jgi:hypothetical protein